MTPEQMVMLAPTVPWSLEINGHRLEHDPLTRILSTNNGREANVVHWWHNESKTLNVWLREWFHKDCPDGSMYDTVLGRQLPHREICIAGRKQMPPPQIGAAIGKVFWPDTPFEAEYEVQRSDWPPVLILHDLDGVCARRPVMN